MDEWAAAPHKRFNPLDGRWVLVSPHRAGRPWKGEVTRDAEPAPPPYDPDCSLCPGNARAGGARNPHYDGPFAFDNDYPALLSGEVPGGLDDDGLFVARPERGSCRVICFSPRHDLPVSRLPEAALAGVVDCWAAECARLAALPFVRAVTAFENRGAMMGASNPHPHGQIWAESDIPSELAAETEGLRAYGEAHGVCLLCAYARRETEIGQRVLFSDSHTVVVVPYWAVWPFEALVLPRTHCGALADLAPDARASLARAIGDLTRRYDRLFDAPFPYSMGFHQRPFDDRAYDEWHVHAHYYPPLLRSAGIRKYSVGYELLAQQQRDLTPEVAARRLRDA
ncbi:MAG TPA: UDP-glucose--hexose-1-phosphate uridylyltransferase [Candidatus Tumulicola sp.]|nr:UDP-glucose--hexose-1-phosphate uridylyltransferase [Candidatus Tumulicola sp.]